MYVDSTYYSTFGVMNVLVFRSRDCIFYDKVVHFMKVNLRLFLE